MLLINFIFARTFFRISSSLLFKNDAILINRGSFFQREDFLQLYRYQFLEIHSSMAETIKKLFTKTKF